MGIVIIYSLLLLTIVCGCSFFYEGLLMHIHIINFDSPDLLKHSLDIPLDIIFFTLT